MDQLAGMFFSFSNCEYRCICFKLALSICRGRVAARVSKVTFPSSGPFNVSSAFQPKNFDFPKKGYGKQNRSFQQKCFEQLLWLHYNEENDSVLCFICAKQNAKENLISATKKEEAFLKGGFSNWNKRHLINSKNMKLPSAIKRLLTTRSIFRNLVAIFTN